MNLQVNFRIGSEETILAISTEDHGLGGGDAKGIVEKYSFLHKDFFCQKKIRFGDQDIQVSITP